MPGGVVRVTQTPAEWLAEWMRRIDPPPGDDAAARVRAIDFIFSGGGAAP
jgi:hypothetical protein